MFSEVVLQIKLIGKRRNIELNNKEQRRVGSTEGNLSTYVVLGSTGVFISIVSFDTKNNVDWYLQT